MQKLLLCSCFSLITCAASAQGTVNFINTISTLIHTNTIAVGGTNGNTSPAPNGFVYALFTAPFGTTNADLTSGQWTFTGVYATNTFVSSGGRLNGGAGLTTVTGWPPGVTNSFQIAGWSSNLGRYWSNILAQLTGAQFSGGRWVGNWTNSGGFYGQSAISFGEAGGGVYALPPFPLFASVPTQQGTPLTNGFDLFVTVQGPLVPVSITAPPQSQTVWAGTNVTLSVGVDGTAPITYQWTFNGANIVGATLANLNLSNVRLSDSGDYTVAVTNSAGYVIGGPATLTVISGPSITNQPAATTGYWGKSVTLTSGATGSGPLSYQWYKDGTLIVGATNAILTLNDLQLGDAGGYTVVVSNAYGSVTSTTANLIVNPAGVSLGMYAGLTIDGAVGKTYAIQFSTNVVNWITLTNLTLTDPVELWVDTNINVSAPGHVTGSYRVQAVP